VLQFKFEPSKVLTDHILSNSVTIADNGLKKVTEYKKIRFGKKGVQKKPRLLVGRRLAKSKFQEQQMCSNDHKVRKTNQN